MTPSNQHDLKINELKLKLNNSILSHQLKLKGRIKWLREQATIARELDIAEPQMPNARELNIVMSLSQETENGKEIGTPTTNAIYLLGYRAIEAEIAADEATLKEADIIPHPDGYEIVRWSGSGRNRRNSYTQPFCRRSQTAWITSPHSRPTSIHAT